VRPGGRHAVSEQRPTREVTFPFPESYTTIAANGGLGGPVELKLPAGLRVRTEQAREVSDPLSVIGTQGSRSRDAPGDEYGWAVGGFRRREAACGDVRLSYLDNDAAGPVVVVLHGLAGQSMGGHTAILAAAACPELVERLVVLEATVAGGTEPVRLGNWFRSWPLPFASPAAALEFLGDGALSRSWAAHLEPAEGGGLVPPFDADVMEAIMTGVTEPQWERWRSVAMPATAVFAPEGMFNPGEQAEFVAARPGTRHVVLGSGSHDAHLDATAEWAEALRSALDDTVPRAAPAPHYIPVCRFIALPPPEVV
jgi:hypothetical protein